LQRVIEALGGRANVSGIRLNSSRLCVSLRDPGAVDELALIKTVRAVSRPTADSVHLILGPDAPAWAAALEAS
jgi:phosphotransferase system IIB component